MWYKRAWPTRCSPGQCALDATPSRRLCEVRCEWKGQTIEMRFSRCGDTDVERGFLQKCWAELDMRVAAFQVNAVVTGFMARSFALCYGS